MTETTTEPSESSLRSDTHQDRQPSALFLEAVQHDLRPSPSPSATARLAAVHHLLLQAFGRPAPREVWDPLTQLIYSLCSSRTKTPESHATLRALRERYNGWPTGPQSWSEVRWEPLRDAPVAEIEATIRLATFADRKAPQLKSTLQQISARTAAKTGALSLAFLARYRTDKIRAWLEQFPGIGSQVSSAIANFSSLRRRILSVDGHHQRVSIRLGFAPARSTPRQVEHALMPIVPPDWTAVTMDEHHQIIKRLGQTYCTPNHPTCPRCPLQPSVPPANQTKRLHEETGDCSFLVGLRRTKREDQDQ